MELLGLAMPAKDAARGAERLQQEVRRRSRMRDFVVPGEQEFQQVAVVDRLASGAEKPVPDPELAGSLRGRKRAAQALRGTPCRRGRNGAIRSWSWRGSRVCAVAALGGTRAALADPGVEVLRIEDAGNAEQLRELKAD
ncbi:MAG: hypothetical protein F4103_15245 [Boseongicola sp. SB0673_bin_14]|nr:hypothetical protein [Boseongicola sp. SB0673_bin_14]